MKCGAKNVQLHFEESGMVIKPLKLDIRVDGGEDDWGKAKVTKQAAEYIAGNIIDREPLTITSLGNEVYHGFVTADSLSLGTTNGWIQIHDPINILEYGIVDNEFQKTTLKQVCDFIWGQVRDEYGVLKPNYRIMNANGAEVKFQHGQNAAINLGDDIFGETYLNFRDWLYEHDPLHEGDGAFDFRGNTPREAFQEVANEFEIQMFKDGRQLVLGIPEAAPNWYNAGVQRSGTWKLTDFNIPTKPLPSGAVYVKGGEPTYDIGDSGLEGITKFIKRNDEFLPWAVAKIPGHADGNPMFFEEKSISKPKPLEDVARRKLIQQFQNHNSGGITVDILASSSGTNGIGLLKPGDMIGVSKPPNPECSVRSGNFRIEGFQHRFGPNKGWKLNFDLTGVVNAEISTKSWYYDPLNNELSDTAPSEFYDKFIG